MTDCITFSFMGFEPIVQVEGLQDFSIIFWILITVYILCAQ